MPQLDALMTALMIWASTLTGLPPVEPPEVEFRTSCELATIHSYDCTKVPPVHGVYAPGVVYLHSQWRSNDLHDVALLLHELVHHMQFAAGVPPVPCKDEAYERQAYAVQFAFLQAAGLMRTREINPLLITCPDGDFNVNN